MIMRTAYLASIWMTLTNFTAYLFIKSKQHKITPSSEKITLVQLKQLAVEAQTLAVHTAILTVTLKASKKNQSNAVTCIRG